ncbi:DUF6959 family protein [Streptomyces sp. NRRL B-3648]|uniref:DUF6959 family protein n=1 Tax=Streptomyces sp. NRRL B-3648 TaxID=1519493 RepID=UPI0006AD84E6|nr:hypothetical protein ADL04_21655 [Streptomyces sp. NRRL B-3648]
MNGCGAAVWALASSAVFSACGCTDSNPSGWNERCCERGDLAEARDPTGLLLMSLDALLARYADVLQEHEIPRPY